MTFAICFRVWYHFSRGDFYEQTEIRYQKNGSKISILDRLTNGKDEGELIANKLTVKALIEELEDREKEIIMLRFYKEKTQTQVAKILGITQVQVSRIERKVLNKMRVKLEERA